MKFGTVLKGAGLLIALYLGVTYYKGAGTLITDSADGASTVAKTFQGR